MTHRRLGFIGAGRMGLGIAKNLLASGHELVVLAHTRRANIDALVRLGAVEANSVAELARASDVLFTCLPSSSDVEAIVRGPDGLTGWIRPGTVLVDLTTGDPSVTRRLGELLSELGCAMVDAPLGRSPREAEAGRLSTFVGGDESAIAGVRSLMNLYADTIIDAGPLGSGQALKLLSNLVSIGTSALVAEAVTAATALGVAPRKLHEAVTAGATNSRMFQLMLAWVLDGDEAGLEAPIRTASKDIGFYLTIALATGTPTRVAQSVHETYLSAILAGFGDRYMPRLSDALVAQTPVRLPDADMSATHV